MKRRTFLKAGGTTALLATVGRSIASARVPVHNFEGHPFGAGPPVTDRLYQGPFSADDYPSWNVVMATTPSEEVVPNYGMGLITYVCDEVALLTRMAKPWPSRSRISSSCLWAASSTFA